MKRIRFTRQTIACKPFVSDVITEDNSHYYFYDEKKYYSRIKKIHEGSKYTITSMFMRIKAETI